MVQKGENGGFFKDGNGVKWRNILFLFVLFVAILFLDMFFLSFFTFNFFIPYNSYTDPLGDVCLGDVYDRFLEDEEILPLDYELCDGFFVDSSNFKNCDSFLAYSDFCHYLFAVSYHDQLLCRPIESSLIKDRCFYDSLEVDIDEV